MFNFFLYFLLFLFYSACGWILEVFYCMIVDTREKKKFTVTNRGFLSGPICPIYGFTAVAMALTLSGFRDSVPRLFLIGIFVCDAVEYFTSYIMEKLFNARWWDYKNELLNIKGRICLKHSIMWGCLSVVFIKFVHSNVEKFFLQFNKDQILIAASALLIVFAYDVITTVLMSYSLRDLQNKILKVKEAFSEFNTKTGSRRAKIPEYAMEFRKTIKVFSKGRRRSRILHMVRAYPAIFELMRDELAEIQSVPSEFRNELTFMQMDLDTLLNEDKSELN